MSTWLSISKAFSAIDNQLKIELTPLGISPIDYYILRSLSIQNGPIISDLARSVGYIITSFTPVVDRLENKGYIARRKTPDDRRSIKIVLTREGRSVLNKARLIVNKFDNSLTDIAGEENIQELADILHLLDSHIKR